MCAATTPSFNDACDERMLCPWHHQSDICALKHITSITALLIQTFYPLMDIQEHWYTGELVRHCRMLVVGSAHIHNNTSLFPVTTPRPPKHTAIHTLHFRSREILFKPFFVSTSFCSCSRTWWLALRVTLAVRHSVGPMRWPAWYSLDGNRVKETER
jgi:hypothetical protein